MHVQGSAGLLGKEDPPLGWSCCCDGLAVDHITKCPRLHSACGLDMFDLKLVVSFFSLTNYLMNK